MLWGRVTYEMMESYWPAVARGEVQAPPAMCEWAVKLTAKPKYVVSSTRKDFPWNNSHHVAGDLRTGVQKLKDRTIQLHARRRERSSREVTRGAEAAAEPARYCARPALPLPPGGDIL
jgi:dihydrofolate reductase